MDFTQDPRHPLRFSPWRKWVSIAVVSYVELMTPLATIIYAPALPEVRLSLHDANDILVSFSLTIYVLGFVLGPLLIAPLCELYGRIWPYRICLICYLAFTVGCALANNVGTLTAMRFLAGCAGSAPLAIGGAVVGDLTIPENRGFAMSIYSFGPIFGTGLGPVFAGYLVSAGGWRWTFWIMVILSGLAVPMAFFLLKETHPKIIFRHERVSSDAPANTKEKGNADSRSKVVVNAFLQPLRLMFCSPDVLVFGLFRAIINGVFNILYETMAGTFEHLYGLTVDKASLVFLSPNIGSILAVILTSYASDRILKKLKIAHNSEATPESRLPPLIFATPIAAAALFWYGWTLKTSINLFVPIVALGVHGFGSVIVQTVVTLYLVDAYPGSSSSVLAANAVVRSIGGALLPLAGNPLYDNLGFGLANTVLGIMLLIFLPAGPLFYIYGRALRDRYPIPDLQNN